jgi:hypothetical protein
LTLGPTGRNVSESTAEREYDETDAAIDPLNDRETPFQTRDLLALVGVFVSLADLAQRTHAERKAASDWAGAVALVASDNDDVEIPERPEWLPARDSANIDDLIKADDEANGGYDTVLIRYHEDWKEPSTAVVRLTFAEDLQHIGDEEMIADLQAVGVVISGEGGLDYERNERGALMAFVNRLLASAAYRMAGIAEDKQAEKIEIQMVKASHERNRSVVERAVERTIRLTTDIAQHLNYGKKKSIAMTFGKVGFTNWERYAVVEHEDHAKAWAAEKLPEAVTYDVNVTAEQLKHLNEKWPTLAGEARLNKKMLLAHAITSGEDIPGVTDVPAATEWWARPKLPAEIEAE